MIICDYGCGEQANFTLKNGKKCCSHSVNSCKGMRVKNSNSLKGQTPIFKNGHPKGMTGKIPWNKGLTKKEDIRLKNAGQKNKIIQKEKLNHHSHTEETKKKLSDIIKARYEAGWMPKAGRCKKYLYESSIAGSIQVDGTWELMVCKYFDALKLNWKRNKQRFNYKNLKNSQSFYTPDFIINDNLYIEIKGYETNLDRCKWNQFNHKLIIYNYNKMKRIKKFLVSKNIITKGTKL
jgi:hypothetical protein